MEWCRLYARMPRDPKIRRAGPMAGWLFVVGMCHVTEQETDGFIGAEDVPTFGIPRAERLIAVLVREGLWLEVEGGWQVRRWQDRQSSAEQMERQREAGRRRQARHRERAKATGNSRETNALGVVEQFVDNAVRAGEHGFKGTRNGVTNGGVTRREVEVEKRENHSSNGSTANPGDGVTKRGTRLPADFTVTPKMVEWARENAPDVDGRFQTQQFIDHWTAESGSKATKRDWVAAWRTWMRNAQKWHRPTPGNVVALRSSGTDGPGSQAWIDRAMERARAKEARQ